MRRRNDRPAPSRGARPRAACSLVRRRPSPPEASAATLTCRANQKAGDGGLSTICQPFVQGTDPSFQPGLQKLRYAEGTLNVEISEVCEDRQHMGLWTVPPTQGLEAIEPDGPTDPPINGPASAAPPEGAPPIGQSG